MGLPFDPVRDCLRTNDVAHGEDTNKPQMSISEDAERAAQQPEQDDSMRPEDLAPVETATNLPVEPPFLIASSAHSEYEQYEVGTDTDSDSYFDAETGLEVDTDVSNDAEVEVSELDITEMVTDTDSEGESDVEALVTDDIEDSFVLVEWPEDAVFEVLEISVLSTADVPACLCGYHVCDLCRQGNH
ncbi:uncharacterized protein BP01DRAFT_391116 [Aspergillus saccharolyticus JOP 1030-1]|uniref:Uncharacterized protein n=1 Tax=Aspergillus saccharolyticus JOP 1030-1 TaxID=1450539 RepID=A0A318ZFH0_9EURO|nr:hypothetical protein BP01DRAFT_391116 [Aspergillus saccharolyticus JOP 1030-1]PYH46291.1 hypothetical protein BP01DRAFT_391116 [Aspergillus saccharolyticus JOP 1030-1]